MEQHKDLLQLDMDPAADSDPSPEQHQRKQQGGQQVSSAHVFQPSQAVRSPTSATITGGERWCDEVSQPRWTSKHRRWWQRRRPIVSSTSLRAGGTNCSTTATGVRAGAGGKSVRRLQNTLQKSGRQRRRRARARPYYFACGMLLHFLAICWWSSSGRHTGGGSTVLVLGASVSVGFGGGCPNACSSHGYCSHPSTETCECHQGWAGGDCSIRE